MIGEIDEIIYMCEHKNDLTKSDLSAMLLNLAKNFKSLLTTLQTNGIINPQPNPNQFIPQPNIFYQLNQQLLKPQPYQPYQPYQPHPHQQHNQSTHYNTNLDNVIHNNFKPSSQVNYPVCLAYVNRLMKWWPPEDIAASIGVPGYAKESIYNYFVMTFWTYGTGCVDVVKIWEDPLHFLGPDSAFGSTKDQIQKNIKSKFNQKGIKLLISAFGSTEFPTTSNFDPVDCARKLSKFVNENNLDGVDIDWQDNAAMEQGRGEAWIIKFHTELRKMLPNHLITHAPQAPYFKKDFYKNGGYVTVNKQVGQTIDFYNVQFYNQGDTRYDTFETLFYKSGSYFSGTSVKEIAAQGVPLNKIVVGKPASQGDAANTGLVDHGNLGMWVNRAYEELNWYAGVMYWQYSSDLDGQLIQKSVGKLRDRLKKNQGSH